MGTLKNFIKDLSKSQQLTAIIFIVLFAAIGTHTLLGSHAATTCTTTLSAGADIGAAVSSAASGDTICLNAGSYPGPTITSVKTSYVTVEPVTGATASITGGMTIYNSAFIRIQGLKIDGTGINSSTGVEVGRQGNAGLNSHDIQIVGNDIGNGVEGVCLGGSTQEVASILVDSNTIHDIDFNGTTPPACGGQGVTCYNCDGPETISNNNLYAISWHYIQCGSCDNLTVDHNLFHCPCNQHAGAHLNVLQIWQGGSNDSFTNNIVIGTAGALNGSGEICGGCVIFENGPGGGTAADQFVNYDVSNNLFVNAGGSLPIQVQTTTGGTVSNNTVADGFQYGIAMGFNSVTNVESTNLNSQYNIVAGQFDNGQAYEYGAASGTSDHNVADSHGGTSGTGSLNGWTEAWQNTTWDPTSGTPPPANFYKPVLGTNGSPPTAAYGYQGSIGPSYSSSPTPTVTLTANPTTLASGSSSSLSWTSSNATSCSPTTPTNWTSSTTTSGTQSVSPTSTTTYSLTCTGSGGTSSPASATVTVTTGTGCTNPPLGDLDGDCHVTGHDLSILLSHYGTTVPINTDGDLDGDGSVTGHDLSILLSHYGQ